METAHVNAPSHPSTLSQVRAMLEPSQAATSQQAHHYKKGDAPPSAQGNTDRSHAAHAHTPATEAATAIALESVSKRYGIRPIVRNLTLKVRAGEVYALVGPNGAGKTTVIRLVTGLAFPSSGQVSLLGVNPNKHAKIKRRLGAVVEAPAAFYPYLTGRQNLQLHAKLAGGVPRKRIREVLGMMELGNASDRQVGTYSLGMRQRLGVASAILTKPDVLVLDEPASGMDPLSLHLVHRVLKEAAAEGAAVMISTHHLDEVAAYCSRVGILEEGVLIDEVNLLSRRARYRVRVNNPPQALVALQTQPFIVYTQIRGDEVVFDLQDPRRLGEIALILTRVDVQMYELVADTFDLRAYYAERVSDHSIANPKPRAVSKKTLRGKHA